jgi:hypothetical protein
MKERRYFEKHIIGMMLISKHLLGKLVMMEWAGMS